MLTHLCCVNSLSGRSLYHAHYRRLCSCSSSPSHDLFCSCVCHCVSVYGSRQFAEFIPTAPGELGALVVLCTGLQIAHKLQRRSVAALASCEQRVQVTRCVWPHCTKCIRHRAHLSHSGTGQQHNSTSGIGSDANCVQLPQTSACV